MSLHLESTLRPGHEPKVEPSKLKEVVEIRNGAVNHLKLERDFEYKGVIMFSLKVTTQAPLPGSRKKEQTMRECILVWGEDTSPMFKNQMIGLRFEGGFYVNRAVAFKGTNMIGQHNREDVLYCDAFKLMYAPRPNGHISHDPNDIAEARLEYAENLLLKFYTGGDDASIKVRIARLL